MNSTRPRSNAFSEGSPDPKLPQTETNPEKALIDQLADAIGDNYDYQQAPSLLITSSRSTTAAQQLQLNHGFRNEASRSSYPAYKAIYPTQALEFNQPAPKRSTETRTRPFFFPSKRRVQPSDDCAVEEEGSKELKNKRDDTSSTKQGQNGEEERPEGGKRVEPQGETGTGLDQEKA
ncbi:MAG: hypothetical protein LQ350_007579 [Teloschistes chrysophthalmus]|nr:MAG: hypothetical protein LQ350_007579 [Niorma chrysophthalma]